MKQLSFFLLIIAFLYSCTPSHLEIESKNFEKEIELQQNLVFQFNQAVVGDSMLGQWSSRNYFRIEPPVEGLFRWTETDELVFSPAVRFDPATEYTLYLTDEIPRAGNLTLGVSPEPIPFSTPMPMLVSTEGYWTRAAAATEPELRLLLHFNYAVDASTLNSLIQVKYLDTKIPFQIQPQSDANIVQLSLRHPDLNPATPLTEIILSILPGLTCTEGPGKSLNEQLLTISIPEASSLSILSVQAETTPEGGMVKVMCNQGISLGDQGEKWFKINPPVNFTLEALDYGCILSGNFQPYTEYELTVKAGLMGMLSGALNSDQTFTLQFQESGPILEFLSSSGMYLSPQSSGNIGLRVKGLEEVELTVARIYENNILSFLREESFEDYYYEEESGSSASASREWAYANTENHGDIIRTKKIPVRSLPVQDDYRLLNPGLNQLRNTKGVYWVKVSSPNDRWVRDAKLISYSDIGLMAKVSGQDVWVFANSIETAAPVAGVTVSLISSNNQFMAKGITDGKGVVVLRNLNQTAAGFKPRMITAVSGKDFTFLDLASTQVQTDRWEDLGGLKTSSSGLMGFMYGDRNLYRPGDTLHLAMLLRDAQLNPVSSQPVKVRILLPNGKESAWHKAMPGIQGQSFLNLPIPSAAMTGTWQAEMMTGDNQLLYTYRFSVEEFTPDRISVQVQSGQSVLFLNDQLEAKAYAALLYGPPASGKSWEVDIQFRYKPLKFSAWPGFRFNPDARRNSSDLIHSERRSGVTDAQGNFAFACPLTGLSVEAGLVKAQAFISVLDETGRAVHRLAEYEVRTQSYFPGIKCEENWVSAGSPVHTSLVAVNAEGKPIPGKLQVKLIRYLWQNVVEKDYRGYFNFMPRRQEVLVSDKIVQTQAAATDYTFNLPASGEYEVRVSLPGSSAYIRLPLYAWAWGSTRSNSFQVNKEGQIQITADKTQGVPGDKTKLLFRTPFPGKLLVTLERDQIFEYHIVQTDNKAAVLEVNLKPEHVPNVFVSATLIKPLDDGAMPLTVAYGFLNLKVENKQAKLKLEVSAPDKIRSGKPYRFIVKGPPNTDMTIAVVDEGVLLMKNYTTPDAYTYFYASRALETRTHSLYPLLFPDLKLRKLAYGGDGYNLGRRVNPFLMPSKAVIAAWSGPIRTNSAGEASLTVDLPVYAGAVRVMASAWNKSSFGMTEKIVKIADPIVMSVSAPPALAPGDSFRIPLIVSKTTAGTASALVSLNPGKGVKVSGGNARKVQLIPNREQSIWFTVYAESAVEKTTLQAQVICGSEIVKETINLSIQPAAAYTGDFKEGKIASGSEYNFPSSNSFYPGTLRQTLVVGASPLAGVANHLRDVIQYPYGCLEQTVSAVFPQLYLASLAEACGEKTSTGHSRMQVQEAIQKLERMQLHHGGFAYWESGTEVSEWGSVYACHFLVEAEKAGFSVRSELKQSALQWLSGLVRNRKSSTDEMEIGESGKALRVPALSTLYGLFVLSSAGKPDRSTQNYYKSRVSELNDLKRSLLASAYYYSGDHTTAKSILPATYKDADPGKESGGEFNSWIRNQAMVLSVFADIRPNHASTLALASKLSRELAQSKSLNTQEKGMALLALGKYAFRKKFDPVIATIQNGNQTYSYASSKQEWMKLSIKGPLTIKVSSGTLYYNLISEGYQSQVGVGSMNQGLAVQRTYLNRNGTPINPTQVKRNDLVVVRISVKSADSRVIENVVITELLPPGLEVENHRISSLPDFNLSPAASQPDHLDIRRDRIFFFTNVTGTEKHFYYLARAVWAGSYQLGPISAESMYDASLKSVNGSGKLIINE